MALWAPTFVFRAHIRAVRVAIRRVLPSYDGDGGVTMRARIKLLSSFLLCWALILFPVEATDAAREALAVWARAYVPTMLPFFIALPVLASAEAAALYEQFLGGAMRRVFNCPGRAAGAALLGLMAGSPAGCASLARLAESGINRGELSRAALLCAGLSPLFLASGIGASMLGSVDAGMVLMRSQLGAVLISGLIFRFAWRGDDAPLNPVTTGATSGGVREAALIVLTVGAYMVLFSVIARIIALCLGAGHEVWLLSLIEAAGGSAQLAAMPLHSDARLVLIALVCGFGGLSILVQNIARLAPLGLPWHRLALGKALQAGLCALLCGAQLRLLPSPRAMAVSAPSYMAERAAIVAGLLLIVVGFGIVAFSRTDSHSR